MEHKIIFAGFGGQGVISMGELIAYSAMAEDKEVTFYPAYGIAMRGGTANCSVVISDDKIASPVIAAPTTLVVMNDPSFDFFIDRLQTGGDIIANSSLIDDKTVNDDIKAWYVPVNDIAEKNGNTKMANMAMLGAFLKITGVLSMETVFKTMEKKFPPKLQKFLDLNRSVMKQGFEAAGQ